MKNLKKLTLNARQMSHAEMKNVRGAIIAPRASCSASCYSGKSISAECNGSCSSTSYSDTNEVGRVKCIPFDSQLAPIEYWCQE